MKEKRWRYWLICISYFILLILLLRAILMQGNDGLQSREVVTGSFTCAISVVLAIYASFTARQKGPILSNSYLWLSEEEKKKADTKAEYHMITIVYGCLSIIFLLLTISIFSPWKWPMKMNWALTAFVIIYAVYESIRSSIRK